MSVAEDDRSLTLREMQKAETRARVVEAARALFSEKGYEAATIREIARRAGVAPGSVFTTFESKTELLQEIIFARYQEMLADVAAAAANGATIEARLVAGCRKAYEIELKELRLLGETIAASFRWSVEEERENRRRLAPLYGIIVAMVAEACERGEIGRELSADFVADMVFACYLRNFRRALFDGWDAGLLGERMADQIAVIFRGVRPVERESR